jgi:hypothetical protein
MGDSERPFSQPDSPNPQDIQIEGSRTPAPGSHPAGAAFDTFQARPEQMRIQVSVESRSRVQEVRLRRAPHGLGLVQSRDRDDSPEQSTLPNCPGQGGPAVTEVSPQANHAVHRSSPELIVARL